MGVLHRLCSFHNWRNICDVGSQLIIQRILPRLQLNNNTMALRKLLYVYMALFFFSCNCNNAFVSDYNIYTRKNNLGDKEFRISLKGQIHYDPNGMPIYY